MIQRLQRTTLLLAAALIAASLALPHVGSAATVSTIAPGAYATSSGSSGGQPVGNLALQDQSGTQNSWNSYVEFKTPGVRYRGTRTYSLPAGIQPGSITSIQLRANYLGPAKATQLWSWKIYNYVTSSWTPLGTSAAAAGWSWTLLTFSAPGSMASYISGSRELRIQFASSNAADNCDLDYEALLISSSPQEATATRTTTAISSSPTATRTRTPTSPGGATPAATPAAGAIWKPALNTSWQWQLSGTLDQSVDVTMYDVDLFETSASAVASLHASGRKVICYLSAGSYENWRPDAAAFEAHPEVLGKQLDGWPGERWLDIRRLDILGPIMAARMDKCKTKGFDGVEPDNIDGYTNASGFALSYQDQIAYNRWLASAAHQRGLSIGLKNDLGQIDDLVGNFDWALNEQCFQYDECAPLQTFVTAGKAVFTVEYELTTSQFCPQANAMSFNSLKKRLALDAYRVACR